VNSALFWYVTQRRQVVTDVSEQRVNQLSIRFLEMPVTTTSLRCVTSQKSEGINYTAA